MYKEDFEDAIGCLGVVVLAILFVFFVPAISFFIAYADGWICKVTFGPILCKALNTLFNVTFLTPEKLPIMAGALGWIGGFFKTTQLTSTLKSKKEA